GRTPCWGSRAGGSTRARPRGPCRTGSCRPNRRGSASRSARGSPSRACRERCSRERGWRLLRWPSCCGSFWGLLGGGGVVREEPGEPVTHLLDITGIAHELESVHQGDLALRRDDPPGGAVVRPEVRVAGRHDAPEELAVGRVVEEVDDLLRDGSAVPVPSPVRRGDEDEGSGHLQVRIPPPERQSISVHPELRHEARGGLRDGREVRDARLAGGARWGTYP